MVIKGNPSPVTTNFLSAAVVPKLSSSNGDWFAVNRNCCFASSLPPFASQKISARLRKSAIVAAKKGNKNKNDGKKVDSHSFVSHPGESTGPFPEAVLLKKKTVQEDGRLLPEFADSEERELYQQLNLKLESQLNVELMRHYEVVYVIHEDRVEEVGDVNLKVQAFLKEKNGKLWRFSDWGLRRLAYKIQKASHGHYILMNFEIAAKWINDFKDMLDKDERVIRHLVMKRDEAETEDCPPPLEYHTLTEGMDNDDDEDDDIDEDGYERVVDDAYYEDDGDDLDDDGEADIAGDNNDSEEGDLSVEDYVDEHKEIGNSDIPSNGSSRGRIMEACR